MLNVSVVWDKKPYAWSKSFSFALGAEFYYTIKHSLQESTANISAFLPEIVAILIFLVWVDSVFQKIILKLAI